MSAACHSNDICPSHVFPMHIIPLHRSVKLRWETFGAGHRSRQATNEAGPQRERENSMNKKLICATPIAIAAAIGLYACGGHDVTQPDISAVKNVVVIYAENRSFDNLYGQFPGANGLQNVTAASAQQLDRDGSVLAPLPQIWNVLTYTGVTPASTPTSTTIHPIAPCAYSSTIA